MIFSGMNFQRTKIVKLCQEHTFDKGSKKYKKELKVKLMGHEHIIRLSLFIFYDFRLTKV